MSTYQSNTLNESQFFNSYIENSKAYPQIAILGAPLVGKTQIYSQLMSKEYFEQDGEFNDGIINITLSSGEAQFQITDVPDTMDQYRSFLKKCDGFILVFALNDYRSFNRVKDLFEIIIKNRYNIKKRIIVIGNKSDIPKSEEKVKNEEVTEFFKEKNNVEYYTLNSKEDKKEIDKIFTKLAEIIYMSSSQIDYSCSFAYQNSTELTSTSQRRYSNIKQQRQKSLENFPQNDPCLKCSCRIF